MCVLPFLLYCIHPDASHKFKSEMAHIYIDNIAISFSERLMERCMENGTRDTAYFNLLQIHIQTMTQFHIMLLLYILHETKAVL